MDILIINPCYIGLFAIQTYQKLSLPSIKEDHKQVNVLAQT